MRKGRHLLTLIALLCSLAAGATHIVGGELYYEDLGGGDYLITLKVYRDCGPTNTNGTYFDDLASVGIYRDGVLWENMTMSITLATIDFVPLILENPCFVLPPDLCVEQAVYSEIINLPPHSTGYDLAYQRCCRNPSIINLNFPDDSGATFYTQIPGTDLVNYNSNPVFNNLPPVALCANAEFFFDHSATDADGDSLVYTFCAPMLGGTPDFPMPSPPNPPPYTPVSWASGFSASYPITSSPAFNIDPSTGLLTGTPTQLGQFVIGICVEEYRNGVLLSVTNRDFQFNVTVCDPTIIAAIPEQEQFCDGLTFQFSQESVNASDFYWDFGDPTTDDDFSTDASPTYTYADTGIYDVMLIANPGWSCADTAISTYAAYPVIIPVILQSDFFCLGGNGVYDFEAGGDYDSNATFQWDFGDTGNPQSSTLQNPEGITFGSAEDFEVTLTVFDNGCEETSTESFNVPPAPEAVIEPQTSFCSGLTFFFENNSINATDFVWDFGLPGNDDLSTSISPQFTYPDTGIYEVMLISSAPGACPDTASAFYEIYWLLDPYFLAPNPQCFEANSFNFQATGTEESTAVYTWAFGGDNSMEESNNINPTGISWNESGTFDVTLTIEANGCLDSYTAPVQIIPNATIDFQGSGIGCPPLNVYFDNNSITATTANYNWNFGDGSSATTPNPLHTFLNPGTYDISLTMITTGYCAETLVMTITDAVTVYPEPFADFDINPNTVNILEPEINVIDESQGAVSVYYHFGDGGTSSEPNLVYSYTDAGLFEVTQTVVNSYGCTATAHGEVAVEGFLLYAPNAFTPNNDGVNDVFLPSVIGTSSYHLSIYNRWGQMIWETYDPTEPWIGNVSNGDHYAPDGLYLYRIVANDLLGLPHEYEGHVVILR